MATAHPARKKPSLARRSRACRGSCAPSRSLLLVLLLLPYAITPLYAVLDAGLHGDDLAPHHGRAGRAHLCAAVARFAGACRSPVIVAEDGRFCTHHGVDFAGIRDAIEEADDLDDMRGGSTITQQVAKNLFLWPGHSYVRKALELPLALWIDLVLSKRRILEIYLNIAEWGPNGQFGVEAGSQYAFHKSARDLTRYQAALLASVLPNPVTRSAQYARAGPAAPRRALRGPFQPLARRGGVPGR